jgi:DNA polymerase III delta prime subunit
LLTATRLRSASRYARDANRKTGFKRPGKNAIGTHRAVLLSGPPGIGKTTTAHLVAKECGYEPLELNASDARSKKLIEVHRPPSEIAWDRSDR